MTYVVDRIEEGFVVLQDENETLYDRPLSQMPEGIRPGDVVIEENGTFAIDADATRARRQRILRLQRRLRRK